MTSQEEFVLAEHLCALNEREKIILNYGIWKGMTDSINTAEKIEFRDDTGDYPSTSFKCSSCDEEVYLDDHYCSNCGSKFSEVIRKLPRTNCTFCRYSSSGLKEDCWYDHHSGKCKYDDEPHWIETEQSDNIMYQCSNCKALSYDQSKYCPNCGHLMYTQK